MNVLVSLKKKREPFMSSAQADRLVKLMRAGLTKAPGRASASQIASPTYLAVGNTSSLPLTLPSSISFQDLTMYHKYIQYPVSECSTHITCFYLDLRDFFFFLTWNVCEIVSNIMKWYGQAGECSSPRTAIKSISFRNSRKPQGFSEIIWQ